MSIITNVSAGASEAATVARAEQMLAIAEQAQQEAMYLKGHFERTCV